jgi:hypothetical protein
MGLGWFFPVPSLAALVGLVLALASTACDGCSLQRKPSPTRGASQTTAPPASNDPARPSRSNARPSADQIAKIGSIKWPESINWVPYEQAISLAKQSGKRIFVLVYADWCTRCRALTPILERDDVRALLDQLIVVRQNQDEPSPWVHELDPNADYVPRIMLLNADGTLQRRLVSGHGRYPFFYRADRPDALLSTLEAALKI